MRVVGAGEGDSPATNTILDAAGAGRVLDIAAAETVRLDRLRLTGGSTNDSFAAGIRHRGGTLRMTECTVSDNTSVNGSGGGIFVDVTRKLDMTRCTVRANHATVQFGFGGGIFSFGTTTLTDCLVEANDASREGGGLRVSDGVITLFGSTQVRGNTAIDGGGIFVTSDGTLIAAETCRVTQNTAGAPGTGGGIFNFGGAVALQGADPSPIVVNNCFENCAPPDSVGKCADAPVSCSP